MITQESTKHHEPLMDQRVIQFKKTKEEAKVLTRGTPESARFDLAVTEDIEIPPGEVAVTDIGITINIPKGYYGQIFLRSSLARARLTTDGGVIDSDYEGSILIILVNRNKLTTIQVYEGDRIAQLVIIKILTEEPEEADFTKNTIRGTNGFGSTGIHAAILKKEITETKHAKEDDDKHGYALGEKLTKTQKDRIQATMQEYEDMLATNFSQLRLKPPKYLHDYDTGDYSLIKRSPYRTPV